MQSGCTIPAFPKSEVLAMRHNKPLQATCEWE
jgi:hypothetical protein